MHVGPEQGWDLAFRRLVNGWEVERVSELLGKIGGMCMDTISRQDAVEALIKVVFIQLAVSTEEVSS